MAKGIKKLDPRPKVGGAGASKGVRKDNAPLGSGNVGKRNLGKENLSDGIVKK